MEKINASLGKQSRGTGFSLFFFFVTEDHFRDRDDKQTAKLPSRAVLEERGVIL